MTDQNVAMMRQIAYVLAQVVSAQCRLAGMQALNTERERRRESAGYTEADFDNIPIEFGLHHNAVLTTLATY